MKTDLIAQFMKDLGVESYSVTVRNVSYTHVGAGSINYAVDPGEYGYWFMQTWAYAVAGTPSLRVVSNTNKQQLNGTFPPANYDLNGVIEPFEGHIWLQADSAANGDQYEITFLKVVSTDTKQC